MADRVRATITLLVLLLPGAAASAGDNGPLPGFALAPPTSIKAEVFAPGLISTALNERWGSIFTDGFESGSTSAWSTTVP